MDTFSHKLNELLSDTFQSILKIEEMALRNVGPSNLSINELHMLEAVGKNGKKGMTIGEIAEDQSITRPSVTVAINKLEKKGYVLKEKSEEDGRKTYVKLTRLGRKMNAGHQYFHENMVRNVAEDMTEEEKKILVEGITKLNQFFLKKMDKINESEMEHTEEIFSQKKFIRKVGKI